MAVVASEVWEHTLDALRLEIDEESFSTWIEPIQFQNYADGELTISVPSVFFRNWLMSNYQDMMVQTIENLVHRGVSVRYELESEDELGSHSAFGVNRAGGDTLFSNPSPQNLTGMRQRESTLRPVVLESVRLNPQYNFENFVVGESNRFAYTAAQAVADPQSKAYNPLFLYGGVGLGKTHLLHAIGQLFLNIGPHFNVLYVSSESFMNAFIDGIQQKRDLSDFRNCFRSVDLLLIDDVQFFAGAERTQTEFFHTFNALFNAGKKIVISSDLPPKELTELEERLRSRFEAGLIVDIQPPDLETRVAILRKKALELSLDLPAEIEIYIAERIKTNIRKLEGALTKISAHHSVTGEPLTIGSVRALLGAFFTGDEPMKISVEKIQLAVCKFFDLTLHDLTGSNRSRKFAAPRQIACFLSREMTDLSFPDLARKFGGRDHTSIMAAHKKIQQDIQKDLSKQNLIKYLTKMIKEDSLPEPAK